MITILIADDQKIVREGICALIEAYYNDLKIVGQANNGHEAVQKAASLKPNIVILDIAISQVDGLEATRQIIRSCPRSSVIVLSSQNAEFYIQSALRAGAKGYLLKKSSFDELVNAVYKVYAGSYYLSDSLADQAIELYSRAGKKLQLDPYDTLTMREKEVFHLVAQGYHNIEIAQSLYISRRTAEAHRANMMRKLALRSQTELVRYAVQLESSANPGLPQYQESAVAN